MAKNGKNKQRNKPKGEAKGEAKKKPLQTLDYIQPLPSNAVTVTTGQQSQVKKNKPKGKRKKPLQALDYNQPSSTKTIQAPTRQGPQPKQPDSKNDTRKTCKMGRNQWGQQPRHQPRQPPRQQPRASVPGTRTNKNPVQGSPSAVNQTSDASAEVAYVRYTIEKSTERLEKEGFHPKVTSKSPSEMYQQWMNVALPRQRKPTVYQLIGEDLANNPAIVAIGPGMSISPLRYVDFFQDPAKFFARINQARANGGNAGSAEDQPVPDQLAPNGLRDMVNHLDLGRIQNGEILMKGGIMSVKNLALSSKQMWNILSRNLKIWNFPNMALGDQLHGKVFIVINPDYDIGEFRRSKDKLLTVPGDNLPPKSLRILAEGIEEDIFTSVRYRRITYTYENGVWTESQPEPVYWSLMGTIPEAAMEHVYQESQFVSSSPMIAKFESQNLLNGRALQRLMQKLYSQRETIEALYLVEVPMIDLRLLSVILHGLSNVTMVCIDECPLLGFADLLGVLDIVFSVNEERKRQGLPEINSLDWCPKRETGEQFQTDTSAEYGISWDPLNLNMAQRGFYGILLKAFMKSESMGLKLLFDKDCAFRDFLLRVPNLPFGVPMFLDGLYRYMDLMQPAMKDRQNTKIKVDQAIYDILKPVRMHVHDRWDNDHHGWYQFKMGKCKNTCSQCGYQTLPEFFEAPGAMMCAACRLKDVLDRQDHRLRLEKLKCVQSLCPDWTPSSPNPETPLFEAGCGLINKTEEGDYMHHPDSVQNLPTLADLGGVGDAQIWKVWETFFKSCDELDIFSRTMRICAKNRYGNLQEELKRLSLCPRRFPDHWLESQRKPTGNPTDHRESRESFTWASAVEANKWHIEKRWVPGTPQGLCLQQAPGFW